MDQKPDRRGADVEFARGPDMSRRLADVKPEERGIPWREYIARQWEQWRTEAAALHPPGEIPEISRKAIWTPRDSYGWRGLRCGARVLDKER